MNVLSDGLSVLFDQWLLISGVLLIIIFGQLLTSSALKNIFGERLTPDEYFSVGLAGWMAPIMLLSALWFLWRPLQALPLGFLFAIVTIALFAVLLFRRSKKGITRQPLIMLLVFILLLGAFILVRLAFVSRATQPPNFSNG